MALNSEQPRDSIAAAQERAASEARMLAELDLLVQPRSSSARFKCAIHAFPRTEALAGDQHWEDGRPKGWPTMQLRVRGKPFDIYCEHSSDVTLDGIGIPVINGHTVSREDLRRGWFSVWDPPAP